ncbi:hypothetical protein BpHYR1_009616, partial [Brachionus plicatilis]
NEVYDRDNTSFCKQIKNVEEKLYIFCLDYDPNTMVELVNSLFRCNNMGLVDSSSPLELITEFKSIKMVRLKNNFSVNKNCKKKHVFLDLAGYVTRRGHIICDQSLGHILCDPPWKGKHKKQDSIDPIAVDRFKSIQYSHVWLISSSQHARSSQLPPC